MTMNESESGLFKVLMWTITTLMGIVTVGVMAILAITLDTNKQMQNHFREQDKLEIYYTHRIYVDSTNINTMFIEINKISQIIKLHAPEECSLFDQKYQAILPKPTIIPKPLNQ